jgi:ribosome-associated toxin RatA of RatAB toxin-antitoxin module
MRFFGLCLVLFCALAGHAAEPLSDSTVTAWRAGGALHVEASFHIEVPVSLAWRVMTDYDHMAAFVPGLKESRILTLDRNRLLVAQRGTASFAGFSHDWEVEREVTLEPESSIASRAVRGNVKRMEMETRFAPEGTGVRIHYRALTVPDFWVPPLVGPSLMKAQVSDQFTALATEMLRRHRESAAARQ